MLIEHSSVCYLKKILEVEVKPDVLNISEETQLQELGL